MRKSGANAMIGPAVLTPKASLSQPHWNTATTAPNVARMLSRKPSTALSGTSRTAEHHREQDEGETHDDGQVRDEGVPGAWRRCRWPSPSRR